MMCFRDMTFCKSDCTNTDCFRNVTEKVREDAIKWWGSPDFPIALSNFSESCKDYKK